MAQPPTWHQRQASLPGQQLLFTWEQLLGFGRGREAAPVPVTQICSLSGGGGEAAAAADSLSSPHTPPDLPSFLLPQSHPQLQQSAFLDSASSRSTLRGKSRAHHQALGPWHVLPLSGSGGWQGSALTTQELGKQILPIRTNAPKTALATIGCVFGKVI